VCWSGTGDRVISGSYDCSVRVWDVSTEECLMILRGHTYLVISVTCSCDSSLIASGSWDEMVQVYDAQSGDVLQTISVGGLVQSIRFSTNGDKLFYTNRKSATIWDLSRKEKVSTINHGGDRWATFSRDRTHVASVGDKLLKIWTTENGYSSSEMVSHHSKEIQDITFVPDGRLMTSRCDDYAKVWDTTSGDCLFICYTHSLRSIVLSPNSAFFACFSTRNSHIEIWDANTRCLVNATHIEIDFKDVALSPCGSRLVSRSSSNIILWDLKSGECLAYLDIDFPIPLWPRIAFAVDRTSIFIYDHDYDKRQCWHISLAPSSNRYDFNITKFTSLPLVFIPEWTYRVTSVSRQGCHFNNNNLEWGWILDEDEKHLLWLPQDRRSSGRGRSGFHDKKIAIGTNNFRVYVVDFSDVLQ
jgi:WD40 repeat protein